ncbi:hypothetical protein [Streptomyces sp. NPDC056660]|uniref:hypothetical protein n=1 Tax=Streptomyces sp. NPDC056660 TaxID=3345897 RepID=UPI0036C80D43
MTRTLTAAAVLLAVLAVAGCSSGPSYNETVNNCQAALVKQYKAGGKGKPKECDGVKPDDYDALVMDAAMGHLGWTDSDGNFDENKMLDSATEAP